MVSEGHCNCGSITVTLVDSPSESLLCYCDNCRRAGGTCSANLVVEASKVDIKDSNQTLRAYKDDKTASGNAITRRFCSFCGSPVVTESPKMPGKMFLKASLFDEIPAASGEVFSKKKPSWLPGIQGAKQL